MAHYYVDEYNDGVYYVVDEQEATPQPAPQPTGTKLVKRKVAPHKIDLVKAPKPVREWSDDGKLITTVSAIFIAIMMNTLFSMPYRSTVIRSDCGHYQESLRWINASGIAGMLCVCFGITLSGVGVGQAGYQAEWYVYAVAIIAWILFALQAGFAIGAGDNYRIALLECLQTP
eukprot:m.451359 g.451359  ORF g.451359 m.451359 type:complete len:173 (+) comp20141_c0_seq1:48-566(+)